MEKAGVTLDDKFVRDLTMRDWIIIADVFETWPFRPNVSPLYLSASRHDL